MGIENSFGVENKAGSGIKVVGKIDLAELARRTDAPKLPKPEAYLGALKIKLKAFSERLNKEYGDLVEVNGQIKMIGDEVESDRALIAAKEKGWAQELGKTVETNLNNKESNPANIAEIATTLLLDKILRDDFMIIRASIYDDYENGADQLIVDKRTGAVICGVDDAIFSALDPDKAKKENKINEKMNRGGAKIKYGATIHDSRLERRSLEHIPVFYFNLEKSELDNVLRSLTADQGNVSQTEIVIYSRLVNSLLVQSEGYGANKSLHPELRNNLENFIPSLNKMRFHIKSE